MSSLSLAQSLCFFGGIFMAPTGSPQADFGLDIIRANSDLDQSLIISPVSISIAMAMVYLGGKDRTSDQISKAIAGNASNSEIVDYFYSVMAEINSPNRSYELDSANRVYVKEGFKLLDSYKQILTDKFQGQFENIDFSNPQAAAQQINSFVEQATRDKIKDLVTPDSINELTRLILINAIYFKGVWEFKFDKSQTEQKTFFVAENQEQQVPMMKIKNPFPYYEDDEIQVLGLPYKNQEAFLYVFLPNDKFGLKNVLENMNGQKLQNRIQQAQEWSKSYREQNNNINVELPRFNIETSLSLMPTLKQLGIIDAFCETNADFSGMTGKRDLYISEVLHKAFIETNEEGSVAAAATKIVMSIPFSSFPQQVKHRYFHANHPFFYTLVNNQNKILFSGTVSNFN